MKHLILFTFFILVGPFAIAQQSGSKEVLYVGTFSDRGSQGIYVFQFDRAQGKLTELQTVTGKESPSFLEVHPNGEYLYAVYREGMTDEDKNGTVAAYRIDRSTGKLTMINEQSSEGSGPCHVSLDPQGKLAYVSNYGGGNLAVFPVHQDGSLGKASDVVQHQGGSVNPDRQQAPHMHSIIPAQNGKFIYASDLGIDKIMVYEVDHQKGKLSAAKSPFVENTPGAGPRHFALHPNGNFAFSAEELSSTIASFRVDQATGALSQVDRVNMLPENFTGNNSAADIHVSPDGRFVYASNRGHDSLVIYSIDPASGKLTFVGHEDTRGGHPRNFCIDHQGAYVFVANRDGDHVVVFKRDANTGKLTYTGEEARVPAAVCIQQLEL